MLKDVNLHVSLETCFVITNVALVHLVRISRWFPRFLVPMDFAMDLDDVGLEVALAVGGVVAEVTDEGLGLRIVSQLVLTKLSTCLGKVSAQITGKLGDTFVFVYFLHVPLEAVLVLETLATQVADARLEFKPIRPGSVARVGLVEDV